MSYRFVDLRVIAAGVDPDAVTRIIGLTPDRTRTASSERRDRKRINDAGLWVYGSHLDEAAPLEDHLKAVLAILDKKAEAIHQLTARGWEVGLFCSEFADPPSARIYISPQLATRIGELGLTIMMDIYVTPELNG